jgi:hypothetical protein
MDWTSPLKKPKKTKEEKDKEEFKKVKCVVPAATVKKVTGVSQVDEVQCRWMERWIDQLVRENSYPPQLRGADFYSLLGTFFSGDEALRILERARGDFARAFPLTQKTKEDDLSWLAAVLRLDAAALKDLPQNYLV